MSEIPSYSPPELRRALKQAWEESSAYREKNGIYPRMRIGLILWHIKRKNLYKVWGYKSLVQYLNAEVGGLALMTANLCTFAAHRLWRFFGYSLNELEQFDLVNNNRLRRCISLADSRDDFERYLQAGEGIFRNSGRYYLTIGDTQKITWPRAKFSFNGQSFRLIDRLLSHIITCLQVGNTSRMSQEQALTIIMLTYEVLLSHAPRDAKRLEAALRQELIRFDLPIEAANLSKMRWRRVRKQSEKGVKLQEIAHVLIETEPSQGES